MTDYEEAVEHAERDRWDGEKVHRGDGFAMIAEKGEPTLGWLRIPGRSFYPTGDRSFRDIETKHEQFPMDAWRSPGRILSHHPENPLSNFLASLSSPERVSHFGNQSPI
jgi:hypothetical protein